MFLFCVFGQICGRLWKAGWCRKSCVNIFPALIAVSEPKTLLHSCLWRYAICRGTKVSCTGQCVLALMAITSYALTTLPVSIISFCVRFQENHFRSLALVLPAFSAHAKHGKSSNSWPIFSPKTLPSCSKQIKASFFRHVWVFCLHCVFNKQG